jgi:hypothetical protein
MKTRIALGAGLLLTIGSAVAGTLMYGQVRIEPSAPIVTQVAQQEVTPQAIAMWKTTAAPSNYVTPRVPI